MPLLLNYWKQIIVISSIFFILTAVYFKGRKDYANHIEKKTFKEIVRNIETVERERDKTEKIRTAIRINRQSNKEDDIRDSCILSNDPFTKGCLK